MEGNDDIKPDFRKWRIEIFMSAEDQEAIEGTVGAAWPNLILREAVENGATVYIVAEEGHGP